MYDLLMKWQTTFLVLFLVLLMALFVVLVVVAVINAWKAKTLEGGDKGDDEQEL